MTWKWLTAMLFALCVVICVWIYLRDRTTAALAQPESKAALAAQADGSKLLDALASPPACGGRCGVDVYRSSSADRWRVALTGPSWQRCFDITVSDFNYSDARGFSGVRLAPCPAPGD